MEFGRCCGSSGHPGAAAALGFGMVLVIVLPGSLSRRLEVRRSR